MAAENDTTGEAADGCGQRAPDSDDDGCAMVALPVDNNGDGVASHGTLPDPLGAELAQVADTWPALSAAMRAGILAMIKAAGADGA